MHLKAIKRVLLSLTMLLVLCGVSFAASTSQALHPLLKTAADGTPVGRVIVTFQTTNGLQASHLAILQSVGILKGRTYPHLGMIAVTATAGQVRALLNKPGVLSVWSNDQLAYYNNETRILTGVDKMRTDPNFIRMNGGQPVSGSKGGIAVLVNDSGIDGTHSDTHYPEHVIQNVHTFEQ